MLGVGKPRQGTDTRRAPVPVPVPVRCLLLHAVTVVIRAAPGVPQGRRHRVQEESFTPALVAVPPVNPCRQHPGVSYNTLNGGSLLESSAALIASGFTSS